MKIGVIGAGRLGICFALLLEEAGYDVVVSDVRSGYIKSLQENEISTNEPLVADLLKDAKNLKATTSNQEVIEECDIIYTFVSTPSTAKGDYDVSAVWEVVRDIKHVAATSGKVKDKAFVVGCTTNPGDCIKFQDELIDVDVFYNPEFIAQGSIINDLRHADMVLIGGHGYHADHITRIYDDIQVNTPKINVMSTGAAELVKLAVNCYLTTKISFANMVGEVMALNGMGDEIKNVLSAIGADSRVGSKYLGYGYGFGGPCLPRDNRAWAYSAKKVGLEHNLGFTTDEFNKEHAKFLADYFHKKNKKKLPFLFADGITYKKGTDIIEESQQMLLCKDLMKKGHKVVIFDLPEVAEMVYTDWMYTWPGKFQFIYDEDKIPKEVFKVEF